MSSIYPGFDLLCSPSMTEGFSNAIGEGMACGLPCVVTNVGDSARIIGDTGFVVPPGEPAAMASALEQVCLLSACEREDLWREGPQAHRRAVQRADDDRKDSGSLQRSGSVRRKIQHRRVSCQMNTEVFHDPELDKAADAARFPFGRNWMNLVDAMSESRICGAERSLRELLGAEDLRGCRFLDAGSGSGLFSLAARRVGAEVHSFDFDEYSVACTRELEGQVLQWRSKVDRGTCLGSGCPLPRIHRNIRRGLLMGGAPPHRRSLARARQRDTAGQARWQAIGGHLQRSRPSKHHLAFGEARLQSSAATVAADFILAGIPEAMGANDRQGFTAGQAAADLVELRQGTWNVADD